MKFVKDSVAVYAGVKLVRRAKRGNISGGLENLGWDAMDKMIREYEAKQQAKKEKVTQ